MKQYLWMKVIAGLAALGALLFGISIMEADPALRVTQEVSMADIEAGKWPPEGQLISVNDAWLLPTWVVEYSHSRRRGDHAYVHVGLGSRATFERAATGQPVDVKLWMKLPQDFRTREEATAAMNRDALYAGAQNHHGVLNALPESVRSSIHGDGHFTSSATWRLEEGSTPNSQGDGVGLVAAGLLGLLMVVAWLGVDHANDGWRRDLARADTTTFQGASPWLMAFGIALLMAPVLVFFAMSVWVDVQQLDSALITGIAVLLMLAAVALWRHRVAYLVTPQGLARAGRGGVQPLVSWDDVDALSLSQRNFRGSVQVTYVLHAGRRKHKVGNGLFTGGVDAHAALGQVLRDQVNRRLGPALWQRLAAGERVAFGALGASRDGLVKGRLETGELLPWHEIESTALKDGKLRIKRKGKLMAWENVALGKLRNPDLLLTLIEQRGVGAASAV